MHVLVLGAGAIGGYFGARLIEAGHRVEFLVRPARAARLAKQGLRVCSQRGDFAAPVQIYVGAAVANPPDLVILSCKAYDLASAIEAIAPTLGDATRVLPLLNGLQHLDALDDAFGKPRILGGLCHISVTLDDDGSIRHFGRLEKLTFGSREAEVRVPPAIADGLHGIGSGVVASDDVLGAMWDKFGFIATLAGLTCLMRATVGQIVATPEGSALSRRLHAECVAIAAAAGHPVLEAAIRSAQAILTAPDSPLKASMLRDLERGARTECEHILGDLRERAIGFEIDTPVLEAALAHVRVYEAARTRQ